MRLFRPRMAKRFALYSAVALLTVLAVSQIHHVLDVVPGSGESGLTTLVLTECTGCPVEVPSILDLKKTSVITLRRPAPGSEMDLDINTLRSGAVDMKTLAIIIPYRDRRENLRRFLEHMVPFLCTQKLRFWIFVVNQTSDGLFNRAKLCNIGFLEAAAYNFDYVVFHDVDKLPVDKRNSYAWPFDGRKECGSYHLAVTVEQFGYKSLGDRFVGGALMFSAEQFRRIGGMPNFYWGWGAEDDETYDRIKKRAQGHGDWICRPPDEIARYLSVSHKGDAPGKVVPENSDRYKCNYEMMLDYREGRRDTDQLTDAKYDVMHYVTWKAYRTTVVTTNVCRGNYQSRCNKNARDVSCPL